jgi:hypothetical protein
MKIQSLRPSLGDLLERLTYHERKERDKKWLENLLPHVVYNKLWQLDLVVTSHMYSHGVKLKSLLPNWGRKKFSGGVHELFK